MQAGIARTGRTILALFVAAAMVLSVMFLLADPATAEHIDDTGTLQSNCVEFQEGTTGVKSPPDFLDVDITLDSWADTPGDPHTVNFTITGLAVNQFVDISVKSGSEQSGAGTEEDGPYLNGSHSFTNSFQQAISHIRLCVFEDTTTTTEAEETTTTEAEETTTTVEQTTTTVEILDSTVTTEDTTTTTVEILDSTLTTEASTTSSIEDEVLGTEVLPFTGVDNDLLALLAGSLAMLGSLVLIASRRVED